MKILIVGDEISMSENITCYSEMWMYYLCVALKNSGAKLKYHPRYCNGTDTNVYIQSVLSAAESMHAILAPGVRYFTTIPAIIGLTLRRDFPGWVTHIHDGSLLDSAPVDITFTVRDDSWRYRDNHDRMLRHALHNIHIGWAASDEYFYPIHSNQILKIFVDHCAFDTSGFDTSLTVQMNLRHLQVPFIAKTLTDDGIITIDPDNISIKPYCRKTISVQNFASELREVDIFIVTHPESLGLTVLEAAKCGAFILAPENFIAKDLLSQVEHSVFGPRIYWHKVLSRINKSACAARVANCTWSAVAYKVLAALTRSKTA